MFDEFQAQAHTRIEANPSRFYAIADIMQRVKPGALEVVITALAAVTEEVEAEVRRLAEADRALVAESTRLTRRRPNPFDQPQKGDDDPLSGLMHSMSGSGNFVSVIHGIVASILDGYKQLRDTAQRFKPEPLVLMAERISDFPKNFQEMQTLSYQLRMNQKAVGKFIGGALDAETATNRITKLGRGIVDILDQYYGQLLRRHSLEGIGIHEDPVVTDIAMSIYENVDANGEIRDGKDPDEVSAYSIRKAVLLANAVRGGILGHFIQDTSRLVSFIQDHLRALWTQANALATVAKDIATEIRQVLRREWDRPHVMSEHSFMTAVETIEDLDPRRVVFKEKTGLMTVEERHELRFENDTLSRIARMLSHGIDGDNIIRYVLDRKKKLRDYHLEQNSFFVCRIGQGNMFTGEAPGGLYVVPGSKPNVTLEEVKGSGFEEVQGFIDQVTHGAKWHDLFVATSPSKRADKSNVLLVGPQGCGKTEVLRAVASDRKSIGIFAQASDFLTCWKGEAEKNPKRLFEAGFKIQKESGKQVFFLIDEIDTILNGDRGQAAFGGFNLATEFQVLMDGITTYPYLALWGATNAPERIPMPLIRRFAKVVIVGELDQEARVKLLQQFMSYLPLAGFTNGGAWEKAAQRLEGAVGDIIRKVVDLLWREKMTQFVELHPEEAENLVSHLNMSGKFEVG